MRKSVDRAFSGHTLIELVVVYGLLLVLIGVACALWSISVSAFSKVDRKTKLAGDLQVVTSSVRKETGVAPRLSFSFVDSPTVSGLSFLSPRRLRATGQGVGLDSGTFSLIWQKYMIFYLDKSNRQVLYRELPLPIGALPNQKPLPIEQVDLGGGLQSLEWYCKNGSRLASGVDVLSAKSDKGLVIVQLEGYGDDGKAQTNEKLSWEIVTKPSN